VGAQTLFLLKKKNKKNKKKKKKKTLNKVYDIIYVASEPSSFMVSYIVLVALNSICYLD
jgi:hypothetical protein